jgi:U4/U6.U5 tri-snRNP-associated protein 1
LILASTENQEISDYLKEGDIGFKKPKKKKMHATRKVEESDITPDANLSEGMDVDQPVAPSRNLDTNFVDDDELQAALARSRKAKMKKVSKLSPKEIARRGA